MPTTAQTKPKRFAMVVTEKMADDLYRVALQMDIAQSELVRRALQEYLSKHIKPSASQPAPQPIAPTWSPKPAGAGIEDRDAELKRRLNQR